MESKRSFAHTAAQLALWLGLSAGFVLILMLAGRILPVYMPAAQAAILTSLAGALMFVLLVLSVVCGFIALSGVKHHGREGVLIPAAIGMSISAVMLVPMLYGIGQAAGSRFRGAQARDVRSFPGPPSRGQETPVRVTTASSAPASRPGGFISASNCADVVYDDRSGVLYMTAGSQLMRYSTVSNAPMTPLELGGSLAGIDIAPDGRKLAIADRTRGGDQVWVHLYDIEAAADEKILLPRAAMEGGTFSVVFGADHALYVTSRFEGSGRVPFRRYDPATRHVAELRQVNANTMLAASADRQTIAFAEGDISSGPFGAYDVRQKKVIFEHRVDRFLWEISVSRDGTQFAIPTHVETLIQGPDPRAIGNSSEGRPVGAVFHPVRDVAFFAWSEGGVVRAYDTRTWRELERIDVGVPIETTGNRAFIEGRLKASADGSRVFCTVKGGVCCLKPQLKEAPGTLSADRR